MLFFHFLRKYQAWGSWYPVSNTKQRLGASSVAACWWFTPAGYVVRILFSRTS